VALAVALVSEELVYVVGLNAKDQRKVVLIADGISGVVALCRDEKQARIIAASYDKDLQITYWPVIMDIEKRGYRLKIIIEDIDEECIGTVT
jgi:hypothetical protein